MHLWVAGWGCGVLGAVGAARARAPYPTAARASFRVRWGADRTLIASLRARDEVVRIGARRRRCGVQQKGLQNSGLACRELGWVGLGRIHTGWRRARACLPGACLYDYEGVWGGGREMGKVGKGGRMERCHEV